MIQIQMNERPEFCFFCFFFKCLNAALVSKTSLKLNSPLALNSARPQRFVSGNHKSFTSKMTIYNVHYVNSTDSNLWECNFSQKKIKTSFGQNLYPNTDPGPFGTNVSMVMMANSKERKPQTTVWHTQTQTHTHWLFCFSVRPFFLSVLVLGWQTLTALTHTHIKEDWRAGQQSALQTDHQHTHTHTHTTARRTPRNDVVGHSETLRFICKTTG